eukprot:293758-Chlamydomonas_euryale.AAC.1
MATRRSLAPTTRRVRTASAQTWASGTPSACAPSCWLCPTSLPGERLVVPCLFARWAADYVPSSLQLLQPMSLGCRLPVLLPYRGCQAVSEQLYRPAV